MSMAGDYHAKTERWIELNPQAYLLFRRFAEQMRQKHRRFGIGQLTERVRWEMAFEYDDRDFKINNNYRAYIARRLVKDDPRLAPYIEMRVVMHGPDAGKPAAVEAWS